MKDLTILVDLDNTCNDLTSPFIDRVFARGYNFDYSKYDSWDLDKAIIADKPTKVMTDIFDDITFWDNLTPLPGCQETLKKLNSMYNIVIVTVPWKPLPMYQESKKKWIRKYFGFLRDNQIVFSSKKWLVPGDVIIDDKPEFLEKSNGDKITIKHSQIYNTNVQSDFEFTNWSEIPKIFKKIESL